MKDKESKISCMHPLLAMRKTELMRLYGSFTAVKKSIVQVKFSLNYNRFRLGVRCVSWGFCGHYMGLKMR